MARLSRFVTDLVIAAGAQQSNGTSYRATEDNGELDDADAVLIMAPDALTGTLTVQCGPNADGNFVVLQSPPGTDITLAAGKAIVITDVPYPKIAVISAAAEGAQRTIRVRKQVK